MLIQIFRSFFPSFIARRLQWLPKKKEQSRYKGENDKKKKKTQHVE